MVTGKLINAISKSGMKKNAIAEKLDISVASLNNKLAGRTDFTVEEAINLLDIIGVSRSNFVFYFAQKGECR